MRRIFHRVLNFFFPRVCAACRADMPAGSSHLLCDACWSAVPRWTGLACVVCGLPLPDGGMRCHQCRKRRRAFRACRSAGIYDGVLKTCLWQLKYGGKDFMARPLGRLLAEEWNIRPELGPADAAAAVPLHFWKRQRRGYNQSELLAEDFCRRSGVPLLRGELVRRRSTRSQISLQRDERFDNVADAFGVRRPEAVRGKWILLVDDVCTTGATLEACARALKDAGARRVTALTVARQT